MVKDVLECKRVVNEFHEKVLKAVKADYQKFADNVKFEKIHGEVPIDATLHMDVTIDNEVLDVMIMLSKDSDERGKLVAMYVEGFGEIPIQYSNIYLPVNFSA